MNFHLMLGEKKMKNSFKTIFSAPLALIVNLLLIYVSFSLCRLLFIWVNHNYFTDLTFSHFGEVWFLIRRLFFILMPFIFCWFFFRFIIKRILNINLL